MLPCVFPSDPLIVLESSEFVLDCELREKVFLRRSRKGIVLIARVEWRVENRENRN